MTKKIKTVADNLKYLNLENYKAFINRQSIPIKNITLIFGHNSSGKSSIIESLTLLKENLRNFNITGFTSKGNYKLPTFKEIISNGDHMQSLKISTGCEFVRKTNVLLHGKNMPYYITEDNAKVERNFNWNKGKAVLSSIKLLPIDYRHNDYPVGDNRNIISIINLEKYNFKKHGRAFYNYNLFDSGLSIYNKENTYFGTYSKSFNINHQYFDKLRDLFYDERFKKFFIFSIINALYPMRRFPSFRGGLGIGSLRSNKDLAKLEKLKIDEAVKMYLFYIEKFNIKKEDIPLKQNSLLSEKEIDFSLLHTLENYLEVDRSINRRRIQLPSLNFFETDKNKLRDVLDRFAKGEKIKTIVDELIKDYFDTTKFIYINNYKSDTYRNNILGEIIQFRNSLSFKRFLSSNPNSNDLLTKILNIKLPSQTVSRMAENEKNYLDSLIPLSVDRPEFTSVYEYQGTQAENVGYSGEYLFDIMYVQDKETIKGINYWLKQIGLNFEIKIKKFKESNIFQIKIIDKSKTYEINNKKIKIDLSINLKEAGTGVQSILPIILNSIISQNKILAIQEPERSLHPKSQINLASLFLSMAKQNGNSFIIETHSEYIVYKFMNLVREKKISIEDLSFNYVVKGKNGSEIKHLRMDEDGSFIDEWPQGFFTERFSVFK